MKNVLSQTIYMTGKLLPSDLEAVKITASVYVPKLNLTDTQVWRSHYMNVKDSYALFDFDGDPNQLENSVIREICFGETVEIGTKNGGATETKLEKLTNGVWDEIT